jgi:hypothetical protein
MHYKETISEVLIFKTNIRHTYEMDVVAAVLNNDPRIKKWSVDREDIDHVLRVESDQASVLEVKLVVNAAGFYCEELPD